MDKNVKILIIVCVILVGGLGLTIGMLLEKNSGISNAQNNSTGNLSVSVQNASNITNGTSESKNVETKQLNNGIMSKSKALSLMNKIVKENSGSGYTLTAPSLISQKSIYHSSAYYGDNSDDNNYRGFIQIDSKTGEIICYGVN
jgi:hypothetical protein